MYSIYKGIILVIFNQQFFFTDEYNAWGCAFETISLTCPTGTILVTIAQYGMYNATCTDGCCTPDTVYDCSEHVNQNTPSDWTNLKALCDGKTSCAYEYNGWVIDACQAGYVADYMQIFFDCKSGFNANLAVHNILRCHNISF